MPQSDAGSPPDGGQVPFAERLPSVPLRLQVLVMVLAFVVPTLVAKLAGAGWGAAAFFGQIGFVVAVTWAIFSGERRTPPPRATSE